jgi:hypothetical protein
MVVGVLERKNRDFFRQVTLVVDDQVTPKYDAKSEFHTFLKSP